MRKQLPGLPVRVINFDWHGMVKELREKGTVEGLWALLESIISQVWVSVARPLHSSGNPTLCLLITTLPARAPRLFGSGTIGQEEEEGYSAEASARACM